MDEKISLSFSEIMRGYFQNTKLNQNYKDNQAKNFSNSFMIGKKENINISFSLTIEIDDIDQFCLNPKHLANITGMINCPLLGGQLKVDSGVFNLFTRTLSGNSFDIVKEMHYLLYFTGQHGEKFTFYGFKTIEKQDCTDAWNETTTLYTYIYKGHKHFKNTGLDIIGIGILNLELADFIKQMGTFNARGGNFVSRSSAFIKFLNLFATNLWEAYAPTIFGTDSKRWKEHIFPVNTTCGVKKCEKTLLPFDTDDGLTLTLQRFKKEESQDVVLLIHGLTTSTDMFIMPEHYNLTQYLLDHNYHDVWSLDWRGSGRFTYNLEPHRYTIDDIAFYDMPKAIEVIRAKIPKDAKLHIICHCVGSIAFMSSISAGWSKGVDSIISNSVSYTPKISKMALFKMIFAPDFVEHFLGYPYLSPKIPYFPGPGFGKWIHWMEKLIRSECREPACHMVSFMWGWGFPVAYLHKNLSPITHRRLADLFGGTSVHYYRHLRKMAWNNETVSYKSDKRSEDFPKSYLELANQKRLPPTLFVSGSKNLVFPESNKLSHKMMKKKNPQINVKYYEFLEYGHQDIFMGKNSDKDIFPKFLNFLNEHRFKS